MDYLLKIFDKEIKFDKDWRQKGKILIFTNPVIDWDEYGEYLIKKYKFHNWEEIYPLFTALKVVREGNLGFAAIEDFRDYYFGDSKYDVEFNPLALSKVHLHWLGWI